MLVWFVVLRGHTVPTIVQPCSIFSLYGSNKKVTSNCMNTSFSFGEGLVLLVGFVLRGDIEIVGFSNIPVAYTHTRHHPYNQRLTPLVVLNQPCRGVLRKY